MGELDDLEAAGTGVAESDPADVDPAEDTAVPTLDEQHERFQSLDRVLDRLDFMDALDDLAAGGSGGLATGVEILGEGLVHSPYDDLLDAFEPVRDIADHTDLLDDLF